MTEEREQLLLEQINRIDLRMQNVQLRIALLEHRAELIMNRMGIPAVTIESEPNLVLIENDEVEESAPSNPQLELILTNQKEEQ